MDISGINYIKYKWSKESEWNRVYYLCEKGEHIDEPDIYQCKIAFSNAGYLIFFYMIKTFVANFFQINNTSCVFTVYLAV